MKIYGPPSDIPVPELTGPDGRYNHADYTAREEKFLEDLTAFVKRTASPHPLNGKVIHRPYADGAAMYMVAKLDGAVGLITLPLGDAWRDGFFESHARVADLKQMV